MSNYQPDRYEKGTQYVMPNAKPLKTQSEPPKPPDTATESVSRMEVPAYILIETSYLKEGLDAILAAAKEGNDFAVEAYKLKTYLEMILHDSKLNEEMIDLAMKGYNHNGVAIKTVVDFMQQDLPFEKKIIQIVKWMGAANWQGYVAGRLLQHLPRRERPANA